MLVLILAILFTTGTPHPAHADSPVLSFVPARWEFGTLTAGSRAFVTLRVTNQGSRDVTISVVPMCGCLSTGPSRQVVPARGTADFKFSFLADNVSGEVRETYLVQTDLKGMDHFFYPVHGMIKSTAAKPDP
jgi:hypothetical protein